MGCRRRLVHAPTERALVSARLAVMRVSAAQVREATAGDLPALAALRWRWAVPDRPPGPGDLEAFEAALAAWLRQRGGDVVCVVAATGDELVGMAWLVVFDRVPNPDAPVRRTGDVQSVFVLPEHRGDGVGSRLIAAVCEAADGRGLAKLTVDSSARAVSLYERWGFTRSGALLQRAASGVVTGASGQG